MTPLEILQSMDRTYKKLRYPNTPAHAMPDHKFSDSTANGLTKCVLHFLKLKGHMAWRQSSEGRYRPGQQITDVLGHVRQMKGQWLPGQNVGASDIAAILSGRFTAIEVKIKDKQSEQQRRYQQEVEDSGGIYVICRSFTEFYQWYQSITTKHANK